MSNTDLQPDTSIPINGRVRDRLRGAKRGDESYTELIVRLLDAYEQPDEHPNNNGDDDTETTEQS